MPILDKAYISSNAIKIEIVISGAEAAQACDLYGSLNDAAKSLSHYLNSQVTLMLNDMDHIESEGPEDPDLDF